MLRYRADLRTLGFTATYFVLVAVQWLYTPRALWLAIPLLAATCVFSFLGAVATHNTVHCPVFKKRWQNRVFQVVLTLTYGHPVSAFVPGHNLSHHKHTQSRRDVMRTSKVRFRWNLLNGLLFMPTVGKDVFTADMRYFAAMYRQNKPWFRQMILEATVFLGSCAALLVLDWKKFLLYVLIPHQYAAWGIISMNLLQHDGCDADSEYNHSRNFVGKIVNWWTYNNGYHTIHHMEPGLHWSLLPEAHAARVTPHIHPNLDQASLLGYIWRTFVWPGKRLRYDGKPMELPAEGPDEEWIPRPRDVEADLGAVPG
jgi:fatty acid desaturase